MIRARLASLVKGTTPSRLAPYGNVPIGWRRGVSTTQRLGQSLPSSTELPSTGDSGATAPPSTERLTIYESADPMLVLSVARIFAFKSYAAGAAGVSSLIREFTKFGSFADLQAVLMGHRMELGLPDLELNGAVGFLAFAAIAARVASFVKSRIVVRLDVERPTVPATSAGGEAGTAATKDTSKSPDPLAASTYDGHRVFIYTPGLWRRSHRLVTEVPRFLIEGAAANSVITNFRYNDPYTTRSTTRWLFPVKGWKSGDLPYLKTLLYSRYFKKEERAPTADAQLIAIEGFGSYRPAQFADPNHPKFVWFPPEDEGRALPGTPFKVSGGTVWADFKIPPPLSLEEKRAKARNLALHGSANGPPKQLADGGVGGLPVPAPTRLDAIPQPASDVFLMADGTRYIPEVWPPASPAQQEGSDSGTSDEASASPPPPKA